MKFIYKVKVNNQKYIFDSKEQFERFKLDNPSLTFEVIERIDIIEEMEKVTRPPKVTIGTVLGLLNDFIVEQRAFNKIVVNRLDEIDAKFVEQAKFNTKVQEYMTKVQEYMDSHP